MKTMAAAQPQPQSEFVTIDEYLRRERQAETKSEYFDGTVLAMSGTSIPHNVIVANLIMGLGPSLRARGCQIYPSDLKVRSGTRFFYPDVSAICGEPSFHDEEKDVVLNPSLVIEVLSPSTERYDRGAKFLTYQQIPTLQQYLLVAQDAPLVESYLRDEGGGWRYAVFRQGSSLPVLGCPLSLIDLYTGVRLEAPNEDDASL